MVRQTIRSGVVNEVTGRAGSERGQDVVRVSRLADDDHSRPGGDRPQRRKGGEASRCIRVEQADVRPLLVHCLGELIRPRVFLDDGEPRRRERRVRTDATPIPAGDEHPQAPRASLPP